jgi:hypothetical protein
MEILWQDSRDTDRGLNLGPLEYEAGMINTRPGLPAGTIKHTTVYTLL